MSWIWTMLGEILVSMILGYLIGCLWYYDGPRYFEEKKFPRDPGMVWYGPWFLIFAAFLLADGIVLAAPHLYQVYSLILRACGVQVSHLMLASAVIGLGILAFWFKLRHQRLYGYVEVFFAGVAAVVTARQIKPEHDWSGQLATLIGCIYIVSRGLGNIRDSFPKRSLEEIEQERRLTANALN